MTAAGVELVVKIGGSLLARPDHLEETLGQIAQAAGHTRLVIVPGGGLFADAVREVDRRIGLADDEAHWMAILAMDQYAHLLAARLPGGQLVRTREQALAALDAHRIPVLAPYSWLLEADPLPHSWDVTSDSIAAWVTGALGAGQLLLVKPPEATEPYVDAWFSRALPPDTTSRVIIAGASLGTVLEACARVGH
jgi:aspartokinase-like uncharacterized kinase